VCSSASPPRHTAAKKIPTSSERQAHAARMVSITGTTVRCQTDAAVAVGRQHAVAQVNDPVTAVRP
jgi:hypothetical protein